MTKTLDADAILKHASPLVHPCAQELSPGERERAVRANVYRNVRFRQRWNAGSLVASEDVTNIPRFRTER